MSQEQGFRFQDFYEPPAVRAAARQAAEEAPTPEPESRPATEPAPEPVQEPQPKPDLPTTVEQQAEQAPAPAAEPAPEPQTAPAPGAQGYYAYQYGTQQAMGAWPAYQAPPPQTCTWTGMQKFGWFLVGFLLGLPGILVTSMSNVGHACRSDATKMAVIGAVTQIVLYVLLLVAISAVYVGAMNASMASLL